MQHFICRVVVPEGKVVFLELLLFFGGKPVAGSVCKLLFQLCIDLFMFDVAAINFILYLYA